MPVAAFVNDSSVAGLEQSRDSSGAVCYGHKSSLLLLQSDESDGTVWEYLSTIATPHDVPTAAEGPNECTLAVMPSGSADGQPELLVVFRDDEPKNGTDAALRHASYQATRSRGNWKEWTAPTPLETTAGEPMLAVQTESMWLDVSPEKRIMVLKGGRPGLHIWSSTTDGEPLWSHDSNIGAIHNALVEDSTLHFGAAFVNSTVNALQNHAAGMVRLNSSAFGLVYDRSTWSRPPRNGEKDAVMFLPVHATQCHGLGSAADRAKTDDSESVPGQPSADTDWIRWVTVAVWPDNDLPAWLLADASHEMLVRELDPDVIDWAHGLEADRAEFFRMRGVAVATDSAEEYDQCWPPSQEGANWTLDTFKDQGIEQDENGALVFDGRWGAFHMEHQAPLWHEVEHSGFPRRATLADAVTHDNIVRAPRSGCAALWPFF